MLLVERLRSNELGVQNRKFKWEQAREAMTDPAVWIMLLMQFAVRPLPPRPFIRLLSRPRTFPCTSAPDLSACLWPGCLR